MTGYITGLIGIFFVQDALASIAFYPQEKWKWNHTARLARLVCGITLIVIGAVNYRKRRLQTVI